MQALIMKLVEGGIAVYSPHTAADGASHGINAWLAKILSSYNNSPWLDEEDEYADQRYTAVSEIVKIKEGVVEKDIDYNCAGYGRLVQLFDENRPFSRIKKTLEMALDITHPSVTFAQLVMAPRDQTTEELLKKDITSIAICAGNGEKVLKDVKADLLLTGDFSTAATLAAVARGSIVMSTNNATLERQYLRYVMKPKLDELLFDQYLYALQEDMETQFSNKVIKRMRREEKLTVLVSEQDKDLAVGTQFRTMRI